MKATSKLFAILALPALATAVSVVTIATSLKDNADATVLGEGPEHNHEGMTAWDSADSLPSSAGRYYLTQDVTINSSWNVSSAIDLCLNGHSITKTGSSDAVIATSGSGAELNLYDCGENTHYYYIDPTSYLGVVVDTLEEAVSGNPERNGTFKGGYITGGRGRYVDGDYRAGCVFVNNFSRFNLHGGTLIGNTADTSVKGGSYGTIWCRFGDFSMHGGAIIGNYSRNTSVFAANVDQGHGSIKMDGGLIADNTANAGGTIAIWRNVECSITGGVIRRNYSIAENTAGGALYICSRKSNADTETKVHIGGDVEITENRTEGVGGGLYLAPADWDSVCGSISISGSPKIHGNYAKQGGEEYVADNLYLTTKNNLLYATGDSLFLGAALESGANIGISMDAGGVFLQNWKATMGDADPFDFFHSDSAEKLLSVNESGDPMLFDLGAIQAMVINGDEVSYFETLSAALAAWGDGTTLKLNKDVTAQITVSEGTKTLDLNNHILSYDNDSVINVGGGELHVEDNSLNKTTHYYQLSAAWKAYGDVVQKGPATISDTPTDYSFEGGYITSNNTTNFPDGAGILVSGGHVVFSSGTVFGTIAGSGGIRVQPNGHLTLEGSAGVIGNFQKRDWCSTGGIDVSGRLDMTGGRVIHNSALTSVGGLRFRGEAENEGNYCRIVGGEITQNYCETDLGHGIFVDNSKGTAVQIGGSAKIHDNGKPDFPTRANNLHFDKADDKMQIVEPFKEDANVWACWRKVTPSAEHPVIMTNNWSEVMGENDPYNYLHYDVAGNEVYLKDGQAVAAPISYKVSFDSNSGTGSMPEDSSTQRAYTLPENSFIAPEGMKFLGWKWNENGTVYVPGEKVCLSSDTTFTAQWVKAPTPEWNGLSGIVYASDGLTPIAGAKVKLIQGNETYDIALTDVNGAYHFNCPDGYYNLVVEYGDSSKTVLVESVEGAVKNIILSEGKTDSILDVEGDLGVAVGGLDLEAEAIREAEGIPEDKDVSLTMNVAQKPAETAQNADEIMEVAPEKNFEFYEIKVEKKVDDVTSELDQTSNVIEVVIPYADVTKREVSVYSFHDGKVINYVESNTKEAGTFILDKANGLVKIYANQFSTFGISYTPYFNIGATITLGSYTGVVTATLTNVATNEVVAKLENVALDQVTFQDLKRGQYLLTITWIDGAPNTITMPINIG